MGLSASQIDEVVQILRAKLLVGDEQGRSALIASYAGRGPLVGWVRTAARRTALNLRRNKDEQIGGPDDNHDLKRIPISVDAALDYLKNRYQAEFKRAVEDAIATLDAEQQRVLRLHYHDELSIDRIGALLGVHRATAVRWIRAASDAVRDETQRLLHARLGLSSAELDSLVGLVQSQLHLKPGPPATAAVARVATLLRQTDIWQCCKGSVRCRFRATGASMRSCHASALEEMR